MKTCMLSGITENTAPHSAFRETAGVSPTCESLQALAFGGKIDAADLPEVAVAELAPRACAAAARRPCEPKTRRSELVAHSSPSGLAFGLLRTEALMTEL